MATQFSDGATNGIITKKNVRRRMRLTAPPRFLYSKDILSSSLKSILRFEHARHR